jgi:hypothetical protein
MPTNDAPYYLPDRSGLITSKTLLPTASFMVGLFLVEYFLYILISPFIHAYGAPLDHAVVTPWIGWIAHEYDGIEMPVMAVTLALLVGIILLWGVKISASAWLSSRIVQILLLGCAIVIVGCVFYHAFAPSFSLLFLVMALFIAVGAYAMALFVSDRRVPSWQHIGIIIAAGLILFLIALVNKEVGAIDYGYLIGPARKLLQGEPLHSFYVQYPLSFIPPFALMVLLKLRIHEMQVVMVGILFLWVLAYFRLALYFMKDRFLICCFVVAILLFRYFIVMGDTTICPQTSPLRLDVWVLLLVVALRFGLASWQSALAFFCAFAFDNFFGMLYGILYCGIFAYKVMVDNSATVTNPAKPDKSLYAGIIHAKSVDNSATVTKGFFMACLALCGGAAYNYLVFGALFSKSAMEYSRFHIGFLPIAQFSLFWPLLFVVLLSIGFITFLKKRNDYLLLLYGFLVIQSLYFFGRSHDNNLLNLSGIYLTIIFIAFDSLNDSYRRFIRAAAITIIFIGGLSGGSLLSVKAGNFRNHCMMRRLVTPSRIDTFIYQLRPHVKDPKKTIIVNFEDVYCNYRLGLAQVGDIVPFYAYIFLDDAAQHVAKLLSDGFTVLIAPLEEKCELEKLNQSPWLKQTHRRFLFEEDGTDDVWKLKLLPDR